MNMDPGCSRVNSNIGHNQSQGLRPFRSKCVGSECVVHSRNYMQLATYKYQPRIEHRVNTNPGLPRSSCEYQPRIAPIIVWIPTQDCPDHRVNTNPGLPWSSCEYQPRIAMIIVWIPTQDCPDHRVFIQISAWRQTSDRIIGEHDDGEIGEYRLENNFIEFTSGRPCRLHTTTKPNLIVLEQIHSELTKIDINPDKHSRLSVEFEGNILREIMSNVILCAFVAAVAH